MTWVWEHSPYTGAKLLLHLALADHANDEGVCWPSQETLAVKARCSVEWVRQTVLQMVDDGLMKVESAGRGRGRTARYRLLAASEKAPTLSPGNPNSLGTKPQPRRRDNPNSVRQTPNSVGAYREPSREPSLREPSESSSSALGDDLRVPVTDFEEEDWALLIAKRRLADRSPDLPAVHQPAKWLAMVAADVRLHLGAEASRHIAGHPGATHADVAAAIEPHTLSILERLERISARKTATQ